MEIFSIGEVNLPPEQCRIVEVNDPAENFFKRSYFKDGILAGEIIVAPRVDTTSSIQNLGRDASGKKAAIAGNAGSAAMFMRGLNPPISARYAVSPKTCLTFRRDTRCQRV